MNQTDGIWHEISGITQFQARIGDTIGIRVSASSAVNSSGTIAGGWMASSYMPCGLYNRSSIQASLPMYVPTGFPGDLNADEFITLEDAILGLRALAGLAGSDIRPDCAAAKIEVNGDNQAGLAEVTYVMQNLAELRQGETPAGGTAF
jgi:hypothetical protein